MTSGTQESTPSQSGPDQVVSVWAIVLAAGTGRRFGGRKQFAALGGARLVDRVVRTAALVCDAVVVVLPDGRPWDGPPVAAAVAGGTTRATSVRSGLRGIPRTAEIVVVHDAAHPLATPELFRAVVGAVRQGADAAVPGLPLTEAIKKVRAGQVVATLPREDLVVAQTPQAFRANVLRTVHASEPEAIEDSELVEQIGGKVVVVPGDPRNVHVATPADLEIAARLLGG